MQNLPLRGISIFTLICFLFTTCTTPVLAAFSTTYDANGNMTTDGTNCYTYNDANQLSQVTNCASNQVIAQYVYDYQGNRIEKKLYSSGTLQKTVYSPNKGYETAKLASNGQVSNTSYYFANDELAAKKNSDGTKDYYLTDNLGSTNILTDQSGAVVEQTNYYPYGQIRNGGTQSKYLYTGQENDPETGLDYYNSRYYNASLKRFIQPDSVLPNVDDPQQLNRYAYTRNNPLKYTDPSGHQLAQIIGFGFIAFILLYMMLFLPIITTHSTHNTTPAPAVVNAVSNFQQNISSALRNNAPSTNKTTSNRQSGGSSGPQNPQNNMGKAIGAAGTGTIYWAKDKLSDIPTYIGKTIDFARRASQWARVGRDVEPVPGLESVPIEDLSGAEQAGIEKYGLGKNGGTLLNKINSVSPKNPNYDNAIKVGNQYWDNLDY